MEKVAAFDLDGTLSESDLFLLPAYRAGLAQMGLPALPDERLRQMIGGTMEDNWKIVLPAGTMEEYLEYSKHVQAAVTEYVSRGRPYPGVPESLAELRARGGKVALCSNGTAGYVYQVLDRLGLTPYFDYVQHLERGCNKSDLLGRIAGRFPGARVVMIGDRHFDVTAARNNHLPVIGCLYGLYPEEVADADACVASAHELPAAVARLTDS